MTDRSDDAADHGSGPSLPEARWSARPPSSSFEPAGDDRGGADQLPTVDRHAVARARQLRSRDGRAGRVVGRVVRVVFVLGVALALLLTIGRSLVFPDQWTAEIAPYVDDLQNEFDLEFEESLDFVELPEAEYARRVAEVVLGPGWTDRLAEWRALGLVGGRVLPEQVAEVVAARFPAHFDPTTRSIVASSAVAAADRAVALRLAIRIALADEIAAGERATGPLLGLTGVDRLERLAWWSLDEAAAGPGFEFFDDATKVPMPVAYLLRAPGRIGRALTDGARDVAPGTAPSPRAVGLDDGARKSFDPVLVPGDSWLLDPASLGSDDWTMVWGARLDARLAVQMARWLAADTYSVVDRGGVTCVIAILQGTDAAAADAMSLGLIAWVEGAPPESAAVVRLDEIRLRLEACDPGTVALPPVLTAVEVVIGGQLARLAT